MRLIELRLKNLNSLKGEWHIDFADPAFINDGIFAITGDTGAGKTTILDAICLALYSRTPRLGDITGASNEMMTQGCGECLAEVVIEIDSIHYRCFWYQHRAHKKAKGKLAGIKHEISEVHTKKILEDAKSKTAPFIQNLIGMDFDQFTRSIMLAQGSFAAFLQSDVGNRAAILEKITGTAIYAQISKQVFEKERTERHKLDELQAKIDGLSLLSADDEAQLQMTLSEHKEAQNAQRQALNHVTDQLQWLDKVTELKLTLAHQQTLMHQAAMDKKAFSADNERLNAAQVALELDSPFQALSYHRSRLKQLIDDKQALQHHLPEQTAFLETANAALEAAKSREAQATTDLHDTLPILTQVREYDRHIDQHTQTLDDYHQRKSVIMTNIKRLTQEIDEHKNTAHQTEQQLASIAQYLDQHDGLNEIDHDIAALNSTGSRLKSVLQDNATLSDSRQKYQSMASQLQQEMAEISNQQNASQQRISDQQVKIQDLQQQQNTLLGNRSRQDMQHEDEHVNQLTARLESLSVKRQQLSEAGVQIVSIMAAIPTLDHALEQLGSILDQHDKDIKALKTKRQDKQDYLEALQTVASLEQHIIELQAGSPCPLCGATEHPYGEHHPLLDDRSDHHSDNNEDKLTPIAQTREQISELDDLIDSAIQALSKLQSHCAAKQNQRQNEQNQLIALQQKAKALVHDMSDAITAITEDISALSNHKAEFAKHMTLLLTQMAAGLNQIGQHIDVSTQESADVLHKVLTQTASRLQDMQAALGQQKQQHKTTLAQYDTLTQALADISESLNKDEESQQQLIYKQQNIATDIKLNAQHLDSIEATISANFAELSTLISALLDLIHTYAAGKYADTANKVFEDNGDSADRLTIDSIDIDAITAQLKPLTTSINNQTVLGTSAIEPQLQNLRQMRTFLAQLKQQFASQKDSQQTLRTLASKIITQIDAKQAQLDEAQAQATTLTAQITDKSALRRDLQQKRAAQFEDKDADMEENRLRAALDAAKTELVDRQRQYDNARYQLSQLQSQVEQLNGDIDTTRVTVITQENSFAARLTDSQFASEADFNQARLPKQEREQLSQQRAAIEQALNQAASQLRHTQTALETCLANPLTDDTADNREALSKKQSQLQSDIDACHQKMGAITQQLSANEQQKGQQSAQLVAIDAQKQKLAIWQQLYQLIGSADGKKYRTFAQGLTFDIMVNHANTQLHKMSDRYLLIRDDSNALELNVIDNYQGGEVRSTKNLSGGEGFIISLALALGLSQMASQNIRVDSLFLDEGFGTLDEESLDIALDTLTGLQQEGKLIGVISHVAALKERILTQIQVKKLSGGFSEISGQGCYKL